MRFLVIALKRQGKFVNKNIDILGIFDAHIFVILASTFLRQAVPLLSHRTLARISSFPFSFSFSFRVLLDEAEDRMILGANLWNFYNQHNPGRISVLDGGKHAHAHTRAHTH